MLLLQRCTVPEIAAALTEVRSVPCGRKKKDELLADCSGLCKDQNNHERMCEAVLNRRSTESVRALCKYCGIPVSRLTKQALIASFVRKDSPTAAEAPASASSAQSSTPSAADACAPSASSSTQLVLHDGNRVNKRLRKRLWRCWLRRANSSKIKAAIRSQNWHGRTVSEVRAAVSQRVGVPLEVGEKRAFFERQLQRHLQHRRRTTAKPKPRAARATKRVLSDSWVGGVHQEQREHAPMRLNDYLSRKAFKTEVAEPLVPLPSHPRLP